jgi:hypothetical protein
MTPQLIATTTATLFAWRYLRNENRVTTITWTLFVYVMTETAAILATGGQL